MRRVDFITAPGLFGVSVGGVLAGGIRGAGTGGPVPAPRIGGAVQVVPVFPQTPRPASPMGGGGRGAGVVAEDIDIGSTTSGGVAPSSEVLGGTCGCDYWIALARVRRALASQVRKMREEVMGALSLLLAERGLETWEEGRWLENAKERLAKESEVTNKSQEVAKVVEKVSVEAVGRATRQCEGATVGEAAAKRREVDGVTQAQKLVALRRNLDVVVESGRRAITEEQRAAGCEAVAMAHEEVKKAESLAPVTPEVVRVGAWRAAGGVVTRKVEVVTRLNRLGGRTRTEELKGVVEKV